MLRLPEDRHAAGGLREPLECGRSVHTGGLVLWVFSSGFASGMSLLWMDEILHYIRAPEMMIPL